MQRDRLDEQLGKNWRFTLQNSDILLPAALSSAHKAEYKFTRAK